MNSKFSGLNINLFNETALNVKKGDFSSGAFRHLRFEVKIESNHEDVDG
jgi:hypothetical protein